MGVIGFFAYLSILVQSFRRSIINIFRSTDPSEKILFISFAAFIAGYSVYGMTNFDDVSILLYFFVIIAAIKAADTIKTKEVKVNTNIFAAISVLLVIVCSFNIYRIRLLL
jgi:hypothetical protein